MPQGQQAGQKQGPYLVPFYYPYQPPAEVANPEALPPQPRYNLLRPRAGAKFGAPWRPDPLSEFIAGGTEYFPPDWSVVASAYADKDMLWLLAQYGPWVGADWTWRIAELADNPEMRNSYTLQEGLFEALKRELREKKLAGAVHQWYRGTRPVIFGGLTGEPATDKYAHQANITGFINTIQALRYARSNGFLDDLIDEAVKRLDDFTPEMGAQLKLLADMDGYDDRELVRHLADWRVPRPVKDKIAYALTVGTWKKAEQAAKEAYEQIRAGKPITARWRPWMNPSYSVTRFADAAHREAMLINAAQIASMYLGTGLAYYIYDPVDSSMAATVRGIQEGDLLLGRKDDTERVKLRALERLFREAAKAWRKGHPRGEEVAETLERLADELRYYKDWEHLVSDLWLTGPGADNELQRLARLSFWAQTLGEPYGDGPGDLMYLIRSVWGPMLDAEDPIDAQEYASLIAKNRYALHPGLSAEALLVTPQTLRLVARWAQKHRGRDDRFVQSLYRLYELLQAASVGDWNLEEPGKGKAISLKQWRQQLWGEMDELERAMTSEGRWYNVGDWLNWDLLWTFKSELAAESPRGIRSFQGRAPTPAGVIRKDELVQAREQLKEQAGPQFAGLFPRGRLARAGDWVWQNGGILFMWPLATAAGALHALRGEGIKEGAEIAVSPWLVAVEPFGVDVDRAYSEGLAGEEAALALADALAALDFDRASKVVRNYAGSVGPGIEVTGAILLSMLGRMAAAGSPRAKLALQRLQSRWRELGPELRTSPIYAKIYEEIQAGNFRKARKLAESLLDHPAISKWPSDRERVRQLAQAIEAKDAPRASRLAAALQAAGESLGVFGADPINDLALLAGVKTVEAAAGLSPIPALRGPLRAAAHAGPMAPLFEHALRPYPAHEEIRLVLPTKFQRIAEPQEPQVPEGAEGGEQVGRGTENKAD